MFKCDIKMFSVLISEHFGENCVTMTDRCKVPMRFVLEHPV